jgi:SAM-dependent methyltransferase
MTTERRSTFDTVAQLYDEARPRYPEQLISDVSSLSQLPNCANILEIGAGTGIATLPFAEQGHRITAIEMGASLAAVARKKLSDFTNVDVITANFELWQLPPQKFDLVISATAIHWIDPNIRWQKSAAALRDGGHVALFRYTHVAGGSQEFFEQYQACFRNCVPGTDPYFKLPEIADYQSVLIPEIEASGFFHSPEVRTYTTQLTYTRRQYIDLLSTFSDHLMLDDAARSKLFECIGDLIDNNFNGRIDQCFLNELIVARKK